jgi:hypothetical protein
MAACKDKVCVHNARERTNIKRIEYFRSEMQKNERNERARSSSVSKRHLTGGKHYQKYKKEHEKCLCRLSFVKRLVAWAVMDFVESSFDVSVLENRSPTKKGVGDQYKCSVVEGVLLVSAIQITPSSMF